MDHGIPGTGVPQPCVTVPLHKSFILSGEVKFQQVLTERYLGRKGGQGQIKCKRADSSDLSGMWARLVRRERSLSGQTCHFRRCAWPGSLKPRSVSVHQLCAHYLAQVTTIPSQKLFSLSQG